MLRFTQWVNDLKPIFIRFHPWFFKFNCGVGMNRAIAPGCESSAGITAKMVG